MFVGDGMMFDDLWPCRYREENISVEKIFKVFSCGKHLYIRIYVSLLLIC